MHTDVVGRYSSERLPRYTSYPTAGHFAEDVGPESYAAWLSAVPEGASASLYVHVPFCRSMCWYCGCHTTITRHAGPIADYLAVLKREIALVAARLGGAPVVRHLHFGGGTPTVMAPAAFVDLLAAIRRSFSVAPDAEIAVEVDPRTLSDDMLAAFTEVGVTRASVGVQTLDPAVQKAVNRVQGFDLLARATDGLRRAGVAGVNFDLIYGLPHETVASCLETVRQCLELAPDRVAVYGYAHVAQFKKHQRKIDESALADGPGRLAQAGAISDRFTRASYRRIGFDHFARPEDALTRAQAEGRLRRNFQGYTSDPADVLIGLGASAIGQLPQGYVQNAVPLRDYAGRVDRGELATAKGYALTADDRLRAEVIERLMCDLCVDVGAVARRHGADPHALLAGSPRLDAALADGFARREGTTVTVPERARVFVRSVAAAFDAYLGASERVHSRAV